MSGPSLLHAPALVALLVAAPAPVPAADRCADTVEVTVDRMGGLDDELLRIADLTGATPLDQPRLIRRGGPRRERICASAPASTPFERFAPEVVTTAGRTGGLDALPLRLGTVWNSRYPSGDDDGLLWAGRGVSQILSAGATLRAGPLSVTLAPEVSWSENRAFVTRPTGEGGPQRFANPYYPGMIDLPQRFGAGPFAAWAPGQSSLRLEGWGVALGLSSENLWIGSGIRNSILMTNTAPGFPHAFLGTARPVDVWIGHVEALVFYGRLERSKYAYTSGHPLLEGVALTYTPRWVPGLSVGLGRLMLQPWDGLRLREYFSVFQSFEKKSLQSWYGKYGDNPFDNQLASVFGRWVFPESGLEIYGEWAREDAEWTWYGFIREPDHSQAYLVGLDKVFPLSSGLLRVSVELAHLQELRPLGNQRGVPVYYIHGNGLDFTNEGQLLGAGIGPGADSQTLSVDVYRRGGRIGGYLERIRRNDEYYWAVVEPTKPIGSHDVELIGGVRQDLTVGPVEIGWNASVGYRWNRDFMKDEANVRLALELRLPLRRARAGADGPPATAGATSPASGR